MYTKEYYGSKELLLKTNSIVNKQYISFAGAGICFVLFFVFGEIQKEYALEAMFTDSSTYDLMGILKILSIVLAIILVLTSPLILVDALSKRNKIRNVRLSVGDDRVSGIYFPVGMMSGEGTRFDIPLRDITYVGTLSGNPPCDNLEIACATGTYRLFALEDPEGARREILDRRNNSKVAYTDAYGSRTPERSSFGTVSYGNPVSNVGGSSYVHSEGTPSTKGRSSTPGKMISTFKTKSSSTDERTSSAYSSSSAVNVCPNCKAPVEADSLFCRKCGMKLK